MTPKTGKGAELTISVAGKGEAYVERLVSPDSGADIVPAKRTKSWWMALLYPGQRIIPAPSPIREISLSYPETRYEFLGLRWHWLVIFLVFSILSGLAASKAFGVAV